jgi:hypothetical protein
MEVDQGAEGLDGEDAGGDGVGSEDRPVAQVTQLQK